MGGQVRDLRKYRDVIGVTGDLNEAHWNYLMDTLEQMIGQSTHYTTGAEKADFLNRMRWAVNFKGLNGMITTVVSGNADKAVSRSGEKCSVRIVYKCWRILLPKNCSNR